MDAGVVGVLGAVGSKGGVWFKVPRRLTSGHML